MLGALALALVAANSHATPAYKAKVPGSDCQTCHGSLNTRNAFGCNWADACLSGCSKDPCSDYGNAGCKALDWDACLAQPGDADGDGFSNAEEVAMGSSPFSGNVDECAYPSLNPCVGLADSGYCTDTDWRSKGGVECHCYSGFSGDGRLPPGSGCVDIDECKPNGGLGDCDKNAICSNTPGGHRCSCKPGYYGNGTACTLSDTCIPSRCSPLSACLPGVNVYACEPCPTGYLGDGKTCGDVDECAVENGHCDPLTTCSNTPGGRKCGPCPAGYSGDGVSGCVPSACDSAQCDAHGACEAPSDDQCACTAGFSGDGSSCEDDDECSADACGASPCGNLPGTFICSCAAGETAVSSPPRLPPLGPLNLPLSLLGVAALALALLANPRRPIRALSTAAFATLLLVGACGDSARNGGEQAGGQAQAGAGEPAASGSPDQAGAGARSVAGAPSDAGSSPDVAGAAGMAGADGGCTRSCECSPDTWCNPATARCEARELDEPLGFEAVVSVFRDTTCMACHGKGGAGDVDPRGVGKTALFDAPMDEAYLHLIAGGVGCAEGPQRVCVDEPAQSLLVTQTLRTANNLKKPSVAFVSWEDPQLQTLLRWIASGAPRRVGTPSCGDGVKQSGEECDGGPAPANQCPYGTASCQVCGKDCKLHDAVGGSCGDGTVDVGYEACDDSNLATETVWLHGGKTCGPDCTYVAATTCGALSQACCTPGTIGAPPNAGECDADLMCHEGKCVGVCGTPGKPCCAWPKSDSHKDGCTDFAECNGSTCFACGRVGDDCCHYSLPDSRNTCDWSGICRYSYGQGNTCRACGEEGKYCCYAPILNGWPQTGCPPGLGCVDHTTDSVSGNYSLCEKCGGQDQQCCPGDPKNPNLPRQCNPGLTCRSIFNGATCQP